MNHKPLILIVDDVVQNIQTLGVVLKKHHYEIAAAIGAHQALELLKTRKPDLILLDIMMPEIDGLELCTHLKAHPEYRDIPIIFLTAKTDSETIVKAFKAGGIDYIAKPFRSEELLVRLKNHLELKENRDLIHNMNRELQEQILAQKETEEELQQTLSDLQKTKEQVEDAARNKQAFLAKISHEIRTPINAIIGMGKLLETTPLSSEQLEHLLTIKTAAAHLFDLINNILDFSKLEAGKLELETLPFSLDQLISTTDKIVRNGAQRKGLTLNLERSPDLPDQLTGDLTRLRQILVNLLNNSIKFTEKGSVTLSITPQSDHTVLFQVTDTGIGIPLEKRKTLFEAFTQSDQTISRQYGGTGLGLSIVKELVNLMGGKIWIEENTPRGTSFLFTTKLFPVTPSPVEKIATNTMPKSVEILLVEDNEINIKVASKFLSRMNFNVTTATNGLKALEALDQARFDLILMDIEMPEMDGLETTLQIRNNCPKMNQKDIPIIAMTAHAITTFKDKCFSVGMNGYITKPVDFNHLQRLITQTLTLPQKTTPAPLLDEKETLKRLFGDQNLLQELYTIFLEEIPEKRISIEQALQNRDRNTLKKTAHSLISLTGAIGAESPRLKALKLEEDAPETPWEALQKSCTRLFKEINQVVQEINQKKEQG